MEYRGFRDLECYKEARTLRIEISKLAKRFPGHEKYLLVQQIIKSTRSICANIAEGYGRFTYADTRNFFIMARGSVTETMEHLSVAFDENYISPIELKDLDDKCARLFRLDKRLYKLFRQRRKCIVIS